MRIYCASFNGMLEDYKKDIHATNPLEADKMIVWQDCEGSYKQLVQFSKKFFPKPIYVAQHGRRASNDYKPPLNKEMLADTFLAWGKWDADNIKSIGKAAEITGCPLNPLIKPLVPHREKVVLFLPVNTGREEPENILVYQELLKLKAAQTQKYVLNNLDKLRGHLDKETRSTLADNFTIVTGTLSWHRPDLYTEGVIKFHQDLRSSTERLFSLLRNVDVVVSTDEGTAALFTIAHGLPVIVVDGFKYRWTKGEVEVNRTPGFTHCKLEDLQEAINYALAHPSAYYDEQRETVEQEMSLYSIKDPIKRFHEIIGS